LNHQVSRGLWPLALSLAAVGCQTGRSLPIAASMGSDPTLPASEHSLIPTIRVATAIGWPDGVTPVAAEGTRVQEFAGGLSHPRWLYVLPNGDVLVAETNAPPKPDDGKGLRGRVQKIFMKRAGAVTPSANRITLLRDVDSDGVAKLRTIFVEGLSSPFGMVLVGNDFYVANSDSLVRYSYQAGDTQLRGAGTLIARLPAGPINHHWTKNVIASPDSSKLYVTIGSNSNAGENGMQVERDRAAIWQIDRNSGSHRIFASGIRNPNGMAWEPQTGMLWTVANERDELGNDLVPDYLTAVQDGAFYGWPYSYYGQHVDTRIQPQRPDLVASAVVPDYALGAHTASLGLAWSAENSLPPRFARGMFVGQHGSWNRSEPSGYKVIFVPFTDGKPSGPAIDVLTGFINGKGEAYGRPVGVAIDKRGGLLVADDVGNIVWRVTRAPTK
jgi:glucose/arabinose dehydrogenase